ncbi:MAG: hypothetical protein M1819_005049 [Sarea resinae]|nr:MAG: hypothetical protein M1819_005049 [Sarea resinae]
MEQLQHHQEQQRGRSSSSHGGHHINPSPSPNNYPDHVGGLGLDSSFVPDQQAFSNNNSFHPDLLSQAVGADYNNSAPYLGVPDQSAAYAHIGSQDNFLQGQGFSSNKPEAPTSVPQSSSPFGQQQNDQFPSEYMNEDQQFNDFSLFQDNQLNPDQSFDPSFMDPQLFGNSLPQNQSINPADIMNSLSPPPPNPTPPNLLQPDQRQYPSPAHHPVQQSSPSLNQGQFHSPHHSRHTSLDPSTAGFPQDFSGMLQGPAFQTHRRAPSEHSDVSSSVAPSPYLGNNDNFDSFDQHHSPLMGAQQDANVYQDAGLGIEQFTLSDVQQQQRISPRPSPHVSPHVSPQVQGLNYEQSNFQQPLDTQQSGGTNMYSNPSQEAFPSFMQTSPPVDLGQANQMAPPEISIEFAAPSRQQSFEPAKGPDDGNALSPPERPRGRRDRSRSDPYGTPLSRPSSRPSTPGSNLAHHGSIDAATSLSPLDVGARSSGASSPSQRAGHVRRSSTSSLPNRDYILDLADPQRPGANASDSRRVQKHPATFQCTLCPKRFTRAYNLRSHLRTHTDERPFVCTVCGKAFARQHDRKRHEGLHSGEKRFVCRGQLKSSSTWGCGRRFARADALGRHFRSEAGRICIKPLLDEERLERQRVYNEQQAALMNLQPGIGAPATQDPPLDLGAGIDSLGNNSGNYTLPAALLAQYPALAGLQWDAIDSAPQPGDDGDLSGRSSYDASSGGDYFDDEVGDGGYASNPGVSGQWGGSAGSAGGDWASDYEGR